MILVTNSLGLAHDFDQWLAKQTVPIHCEPYQRADGLWDVQTYHKRPVGYHDQIEQNIRQAAMVRWGGIVLGVAGILGGAVLHGKVKANARSMDLMRLITLVGTAGAAFSSGYEISSRWYIAGYEQGFVPQNVQGNTLPGSYEYYRLCCFRGLADIPSVCIKEQIVEK